MWSDPGISTYVALRLGCTPFGTLRAAGTRTWRVTPPQTRTRLARCRRRGLAANPALGGLVRVLLEAISDCCAVASLAASGSGRSPRSSLSASSLRTRRKLPRCRRRSPNWMRPERASSRGSALRSSAVLRRWMSYSTSRSNLRATGSCGEFAALDCSRRTTLTSSWRASSSFWAERSERLSLCAWSSPSLAYAIATAARAWFTAAITSRYSRRHRWN